MRILQSIAGLIFLAMPALAAAPTIPSAVISDSPPDTEHPARMLVAAIPSHGSTMHGVLYCAAGAGPNPTLLLMHGFPGNEQNLDIAQSVRRAGWNVLTFHYRGSWGSEEAFSFSHAIEDADAAIAFLRDPANAKKYGIDPARIAVAGHSMGGFMAAHAAANDKTLIGVAMISAWNVGAKAALVKNDSDRAKFVESMADNLDGLTGCTAESLAADALVHQTDWNFIEYAPALATRPLLLISSNDGNGPASFALAAAARKAGAKAITEVQIPTDHPYSDHRIALQAAVVLWVEALAGAKP